MQLGFSYRQNTEPLWLPLKRIASFDETRTFGVQEGLSCGKGRALELIVPPRVAQLSGAQGTPVTPPTCELVLDQFEIIRHH